VITYPTLISGGKRCGEEYSRFGYRLGKDGRVTITVYNYAMEKVKTIVRNARRATVAGRSENIAEDRWDGCDDSGRLVSVGTYYVLVESDQGEKAFGKVLVTRGRR
jgi:flagellar hook assembly protein FlgD